ncbi:MAG: efflux RND transporter periplasmic adaptor subunit [Gemmatimonadales bacterium]
MTYRYAAIFAALILGACAKEEQAAAPVYQAVPVETRDIVVSAQAAGTIQPDTTVEVKSKASGEILEISVETGQEVKRGQLMVKVDPRTARNRLDQAEAELVVAKATLTNAEAQARRSEELYKSQSITETEYETSQLTLANAKASLVGAQVAVENARIQLEDTEVRAPISGTVIQKLVERGQVISSPTSDVGGGTVLLSMADLGLVQVQALVDETDIGKIRPGMQATVTVDAYPNQPFEGQVLKIEPLAETSQNVTMFPVLIRIQNRQGLLRPGMNTEVQIHVGSRQGVLAIPNSALRTQRDVGSAAQVLGLNPEDVTKELAAAQQATSRDSLGAGPATAGGDTAVKPKGNVYTLPDGRSVPLPEGVTEKQIRDIMAKRMSGQQPTSEESALLRKVFASMGGGRGGRPRASSNDYQFGGRYIVFVLRDGKPTPTWVQTGLTDLDYSEVVSGLTAKDSVLLLPSASLVQSQQEFKERIERVTGGGSMGGLRQSQSSSSSGSR